jgi:hypothetical protein
MCDREEAKLQDHNLGKSVDHRLTFHDVLKEGYAYTRTQKKRDGSIIVIDPSESMLETSH